MIPHNMTSIKLICVMYQFHRQILSKTKIDRTKSNFREYVLTGREPKILNKENREEIWGNHITNTMALFESWLFHALKQDRRKSHLVLLDICLYKLFGLLSKLLASMMRNYFPKRPSGAPLHTLSKLYDIPVDFVTPPLLF